jgi:hypothetical protein
MNNIDGYADSWYFRKEIRDMYEAELKWCTLGADYDDAPEYAAEYDAAMRVLDRVVTIAAAYTTTELWSGFLNHLDSSTESTKHFINLIEKGRLPAGKPSLNK